MPHISNLIDILVCGGKPYMIKSICIGCLLLAMTSCGNTQNSVISKRFIHEHGYDLSQREWEKNQPPGKHITTYKDGVIVQAHYEEGLLHGEKTWTYPHSKTVSVREEYQHGTRVKRTLYDIKGTPEREEEYLSPKSKKILTWYPSGSPKAQEVFERNVLVNGEYYTLTNDVESSLRKGTGTKTIRNQEGKITRRETLSNGKIVLLETFHSNEIPHLVYGYKDGNFHGEKKEFGKSGEPMFIENYKDGELDGIAKYFQNGTVYREIGYKEGAPHGKELFFVDGENILREIPWFEGVKHGPEKTIVDGITQTKYFYENVEVSREAFYAQERQDEMFAMHDAE